MKAKRRIDNNTKAQHEAPSKIKRPQFTSDFTTDNKLFYRFLEDINKKK